MRRMQQQLIDQRYEDELNLIPVSVFWGRMSEKHGSVTRAMVSDRRLISAGLRRLLGVVLTRKDLVVHFGKELTWHSTTRQDQSLARNLRHTARLLRVAFKQARTVALGPDLEKRASVIDALVNGGDQKNYSKRELRQRRRVAKKLVANLSYPAMRMLKVILKVFWRVTYDSVELRNTDRLLELGKTHTLIYVPNHRSHIDYLILSYLLFMEGIAIPNIAAGENLNLPIVGALLRRCGAFFIRRHFRDDLEYRNILSDYIALLLDQGQSIEFFIEGTRSRSGWMLEPQKGLLNTLLETEITTSKPIAFVPIYISYDKLIESETYRSELLGKSKRSESLRDLFNATKLLSQNFGSIQVVSGTPVFSNFPLEEQRITQQTVADFALTITHSINDSAWINATNLVAMAAFTHTLGSIAMAEFEERLDFLRGLLRVESLNHDYEFANESASSLVAKAKSLQLLSVSEDDIQLTNSDLAGLAWYRNNVLHTLALPSLIAVVLLNQQAPIKRLELVRQVAGIWSHLSGVLNVPLNLPSVLRSMTHLRNAQLIEMNSEQEISVAENQRSETSKFTGLSRLVMPPLECMYVTIACFLNHANGSCDQDKLVNEAFALMQTVATATGDETKRLFDRRFFESVVRQYLRYGLVNRGDDHKLTYTPTMSIIQRRAIVAIDERIQIEIDNYFKAER